MNRNEKSKIVNKGPTRLKNGRVSRTHPSWVLGNEEVHWLESLVKKYARGRLADIGCGTKPYAGMVAPYITQHVGIDHNEMFHGRSNVDIFADAYNIPVPDGSFDCVLLTDVLEHLENPQSAFVEMARILKQGGSVILSVPHLHHLHEQPRDFYRYTKYGLEYLAGQAKLVTAEMKPIGGLLSFGMQEIAYLIYFPANIKILKPLQIILMNVFCLIGWLFARIDPTNERLPTAYVCAFIKCNGEVCPP